MRPALAALAALITAPAAAAPLTLAHQGRLLDAAGGPISGPRALTVRLFAAEDATAPLWDDTFDVTVADGFYAVVLGSGEALDTSVLLRPEVWIEVDASGALGPRTQLASVPYAGVAEVARAVDGHRGVFTGAVIVGSEGEAFCGAQTAGALVYDAATGLRVCDGSAFVPVSAVRVVEIGGVRQWADGTYARSCEEYRRPSGNRVYQGATGDGVYRLAGNNAPFDAWCEMDVDGGGWTLVGYNYNVNRTYLSGTWHEVSTGSPVAPTTGHQRAIDPNTRGVPYTQIAFYLDDPQWTGSTRSYSGWWLGKNPVSTYDIKSNTCQLLERTAPSQWDGQLVYFAGNGAPDDGCTGPGTFFTTAGHTCDDGGGGVTTNNIWPRNASDTLWGYNCISSYAPTGAYKTGPIGNQGLHAYYVR